MLRKYNTIPEKVGSFQGKTLRVIRDPEVQLVTDKIS